MNQHPRHVLTNIQEYYTSVVLYPPNVLEYKEKRQSELERASKCWDRAFNMMPLMNQLNCSYLLGCNEYIVKPFVTECAHILACIEDFEKKNKQQSNGCQEVSTYYASIFKKVDKAQFVSWMLADLAYWGETCSFTFEKSDIIDLFKKEKVIQTERLNKK